MPLLTEGALVIAEFDNDDGSILRTSGRRTINRNIVTHDLRFFCGWVNCRGLRTSNGSHSPNPVTEKQSRGKSQYGQRRIQIPTPESNSVFVERLLGCIICCHGTIVVSLKGGWGAQWYSGTALQCAVMCYTSDQWGTPY